MEENDATPTKVMEMAPDGLGKLLIEINLDTNKYNIGFSNPNTARLLNQIEMVNIFSPFHAACIINELARRKETKIIKPAGGVVLH